MRNKFIYTIRWKFIFAFILSISFAAGTILVCYRMLRGLLYIKPFTKPLSWVVNHIGTIPVMSVAGSLLFLVFFFILSSRVIRYLDEITKGVQEMAEGNLTHEIKTNSSDELGVVAENINQMARKLRVSIEEERKAERSKNELITGVSHDLRTPLTSVHGYLELIETDRYKDEVELRYYTNIAYEKTKHLIKLIERLFEYTTLQGEGIELKKKTINLNGFMKQVAEEFIPALTNAGMTYRIMSEDDTLKIQADGNQLMRAFENLISNAIHYGHDGQYVDIRISRRENEAVVEIINYGNPIPERDLPFIFERFYRAEKSRSSQTGGSGLGLAITQSIIERHGGHITARSHRTETVFETRLPIFIPA